MSYFIRETALLLCLAAPALAQNSVQSNADDPFVTIVESGEIDLGAIVELDTRGYPTQAGIQTLYDEMDFQGAVSAYLQTLPQMALYGSHQTNHFYGATGETDILLMYRDPSVDGMLTPNRVVEYFSSYPNLAETGPLVFEVPAGEIAGLILNMQMRWHADIGVTSPTQGRTPKRFLLLTVDQGVPAEVNLDAL